MKSKTIAFKLKLFTLIIISLICFITIYSYSFVYNENSTYPTANKGRLLVSSTMDNIKETILKNLKPSSIKSDYPYTVIDLKGKVLFSSIKKYKVGSFVNLNEVIEYDNKASKETPEFIKYAAPLIIDNYQSGTVIFLIPKKTFLPSSPMKITLLNLTPIIISLIIIIILIASIYNSAKKDILTPLDTLHESARRILKGDFSYKVNYDYDNEVGSFCHDFEAMRDEMKFSKEKEHEIKTNEKELLACLSHDIKTPLTAIHGYVSGIKDGIVKDREGIENYCTMTLNRIKMLTKLLDDILEHSKAELNKMNITFSEFYAKDFFADILEDLSIEIESKGLKFIKPDEIPNILINADKKRLSQVMYNLVSNSIKYSKEKGQISIYFKTENNYLYTYIKDTGIGISTADVPYIFNKFYRGEKSRNQNVPGSGLGLSISKYIVEAHGGFIECVESSESGTIMCFTIPV